MKSLVVIGINPILNHVQSLKMLPHFMKDSRYSRDSTRVSLETEDILNKNRLGSWISGTAVYQLALPSYRHNLRSKLQEGQWNQGHQSSIRQLLLVGRDEGAAVAPCQIFTQERRDKTRKSWPFESGILNTWRVWVRVGVCVCVCVSNHGHQGKHFDFLELRTYFKMTQQNHRWSLDGNNNAA